MDKSRQVLATVFEERSSRPFLAANHAMFTFLTDRRDSVWPSHLHNVISWAFESRYHAQLWVPPPRTAPGILSLGTQRS